MVKKYACLFAMINKRNLLLLVCGLLGLAALASAEAEPKSKPSSAPPPGADPAQYAESHKSPAQRRREAQQRLLGTEQGKQQVEAAKKAAEKAHGAKPPTKPVPVPLEAAATPLPVGINPLVDISLPNWSYSPSIRKFVDSLPGVGPPQANNLGQYVSIAEADTTTYPGSDYYVLALVCYSKKMHSDLPPTDLRGYVQLETAVNAATSKHIALTYPDGSPILNTAGQQVYAYDNPQYLGASIIATKGTPVRILFHNYLPKGAGGNLNIPVDTTLMGAGVGPLDVPGMPGTKEEFTQNRAAVHLHGGFNPWISDGTPHQWTAPAGALAPSGTTPTQYPKGKAVQNVPDMPDPGPGALTFYYANEQSARLMFYHDHAHGLTRLNVYVGEAAGYLLTDQVEQDLIKGTNLSGGNPNNVAVLPTLDGAFPLGIPLIIQDKSFVNDATTPPGAGFPAGYTPTSHTALVDPLWYTHIPGSTGGDLWFPHEYLPNENLFDPSGFWAYGRWDYGPWILPPVFPINPTLPSPSHVPESFQDTMIVNGCAYPYIELPPKLVRLRILNACNDRGLNLQLYKADNASFKVTDAAGLSWGTEVKMVPAAITPGYPATWPKDGRDGGVPDPTTAGPIWWMIGNEAGFLAQVGEIQQQAVNFDYDRTSATFSNVSDTSLFLGAAMRADVLVDLSQYQEGDTLILYNDCPAPMSLFDDRYDIRTDDPGDRTAKGGAPTIPPGFGPNTRTIMQIRIKGAQVPPPADYLTTLKAALPKAFAVAQPAPVVPASFFNDAYGTTNPDIFASVADESLNITGQPQSVARIVTELPGAFYTTPPTVLIFGGGGTGAAATATLNGVTGIALITGGSGYSAEPAVTITAAPGDTGTGAQARAVISGGTVTAVVMTNLGSNYLVAPTVTIAAPTGAGGVTATAQATITLGSVGTINLTNPGSGYMQAPKVLLVGGGGNGAVALSMLNNGMIMDGKQIVEGMDMEYGRMNAVLGSIPNPLNPTQGAGPVVGGAFYIDPPTEILTPETPYLWRLSHIGVDSHWVHFHLFEVQIVNRVDWTNTIKPPNPDEIGWKETIRTSPFEDIILALRPKSADMKLPFGVPESVRLLDPTVPENAAGNFIPVLPPIGIPAVAQITNVMTNFGWEYVWHCHLLGHEENDMMRPIVLKVSSSLPAASVLSGSGATGSIDLTWTDGTPVNNPTTPGNPANEIGFRIERATGATGAFALLTTALANSTSYTDATATPGTSYRYRITAFNAAGNGPASNTVTVIATIAAPSNLAAAISAQAPLAIILTWTDNATNNTGFTIQRATNATFTTGLATYTVTPGTATTYTNTTSLAANTTYYYRIRSTAGGANSAWSNVVSIRTSTPAAPTNLTAAMAGNAVRLTWVDNATNEGGVTIQRATNALFTAGLMTTNLTGSGLTTYTDGTVQIGTRYYYRVRATNAAGNSGWSNVVNILTPTVQTPPGAPTNVVASPGDSLAIVSFTAPASNGGSVITGYTVTSSPGGITAVGAASPIVVSGLTNGTAYTFTVTATNAIGTGPASAPSNSVTPAPATVPGAPTGVTAVAGNQSATVSFTSAFSGGSAITGYTVTSSPGGITATGTASPITVNGLANGTAYTFTVAATNAIGTGPASSASNSVIPSAPAPASDAFVFTDQGTAALTVASPIFSTRSTNELIIAFIGASGTAGTATAATGVTGGTGLTWNLAQRTNVQRGTAEIWYAYSTAIQTNIRVTATFGQATRSMITIVSFTGTDPTNNGAGGIGAVATGNAPTGAPTASLITTRPNSWVIGVGTDATAARARTAAAGQTIAHQFLATAVPATFWVQPMSAATPLAGTTVTINATAPTTDMYNLSVVEIRTP